MTEAPIDPTSGYSVTYFNVGKLRETYNEEPGIGLQTKILYSISPKIFVSTGLDLSFLRYKRSIEVDDLYDNDARIIIGSSFPFLTDPDGNRIVNRDGTFAIDQSRIFGPTDKTGKTTVWNVGIPILAGTTFLNDKLTISMGGIFSVPVTASTYEHELVYEYGQVIWIGGVDENGDYPMNIIGQDRYQFRQQDTKKNVTKQFKPSAGLMMQIGFRLWKKFQADLTMQKNVTPIYKSEYQSAGKAKLNLLSFGFSYSFLNFNSPE